MNTLKSSTLVPQLPSNFAEPCKELLEVKEMTAEANFSWAMDTVTKYNECAIKKDAVTQAYIELARKLND